MKKSQIFVLTAAAIVIISMIVLIGLGRLVVGKAGVSGNDGGRISWSDGNKASFESPDLRDFNQVVIEGAWTVKISQAEDFSTEIRHSSSMSDPVNVRVQGNRLILGARKNPGRSDDRLYAEITMPTLVMLQVVGAADTEFEGFDEQTLEISIDGAARIHGFESEVNKLKVRLNGLGQIDLSGVSSVDANVVLEGAGEILLNMNGGVLDGSLGGMGKIQYSGSLTEEKIDIDGMGSVERRD